jgi:medium-chain acyl-[acyl-carrier-protein] hydrolase
LKVKPVLFLLSHAGGNAAQYAYLFSALRGHFELVPLELPGHGERTGEPLLYSVSDMTRDVLEQMRRELGKSLARHERRPDYAVFGHSLGSLLGYLAAAALAGEGHPPAHLFVSSACIPGQDYVPEYFPKLSADALWRASADHFGGIPEEALNSQELQRYFAPLLQADLGAVVNYKPAALSALTSPVTAFYGTDDTVEKADVEKWRRFTTGAFQCHCLDGGHFYLFQHGQALAERILAELEAQSA